jgi:hypothetical protein
MELQKLFALISFKRNTILFTRKGRGLAKIYALNQLAFRKHLHDFQHEYVTDMMETS